MNHRKLRMVLQTWSDSSGCSQAFEGFREPNAIRSQEFPGGSAFFNPTGVAVRQIGDDDPRVGLRGATRQAVSLSLSQPYFYADTASKECLFARQGVHSLGLLLRVNIKVALCVEGGWNGGTTEFKCTHIYIGES